MDIELDGQRIGKRSTVIASLPATNRGPPNCTLRRPLALQFAFPADELGLRTTMNIYGVHEPPVTWTQMAP
ncbi:hypothetical protein [Streptomyces spinosirectus]